MDDSVRMQIVKSVNELLCDFPNFIFRKFSIILEDFKKFTLSKLSDHTKFMTRFERIKQQNDVFVIESF